MGRLTTRQLARKRTRKSQGSQRKTLQPGDVLQDRYRIVGTLGVGGFSSVYQARDMRFPGGTKLWAIKEMLIATSDPRIRELTIKTFEREAGWLATLDHPAIPDVADYFTEENRSYLVLELIRGKDLDDWLQESQDTLDEATALNWSIQLCDALAHLHSHDPPIVFRDLKPSNIMLDHHDNIRLIDFGIAKTFEADIKGTMIGTEGYSPPEQYRGEATPAGDVYALGATLHHLLTRQDPRLEPPFTFHERPIRSVNTNISTAFEAVIARCLQYNYRDRYANASVLKEALEAIRDGAATPAITPPSSTPTSQPATATPATPPPPAVSSSPAPPPAVPQIDTASQIQPIWSFKCEDEIRGRPAVAQGIVLVGVYDNNIYALSAGSGEFLWKFPTSDGLGSSPCVYEDAVYIGSADKNLYSINLRTGRKNWTFPTDGPIYSSPSASFDHIFFGSDDNHFYAIHAKRGTQAWKANAYTAVRSSPYVDDERVFFGTEGGYIYCLEIATGKVIWQQQAKRAVTSSPTYADEIIFVGSVDATVYALDAARGYPLWRYRTNRAIISSPAVANEMLYIGSSDGNLYALDINSGRQKWVFETEGQIPSSPAVTNEAVYFGSTDGYVYSLSLKRGELRWRYKTDGAVISSPVIVDGTLYIGSTDHKLYALPL